MVTTKQSGLGDNFYIGGYDLSGDVASLDEITGGPDALEATSIKQSAHARLFGQRSGTFKFTSMFEQTPTIATPAFPLSTVPVTNTYNVPVYVTITGGTLTNVLVNGVSAGTTAGTYPVPAGGTISVTYSVAPTWNWFALGAEHSALAPLPRTDAIATYARGTAIGNPAACIFGRQLNYDGTRDNKGNLTFQAEIDSDGFGMEWGVLLTPGLRTDTTATNGVALDGGAGFVTPGVPLSNTPVTNTSPLPASVVISAGTLTAVLVNGIQVGTGDGTYIVPSGQTIAITYSVAPTWVWTLQTTFGAQAYLQLLDIVGTSVDVAVQGSPDNATWTTIASLDFGALSTSPQALRLASANNVAIARYLRAITSGVFSYAIFAVAINRNPIAGVTF